MNEGKSRTAPFDVFKAEIDGSVLWMGSAASLAEASARVHKLGIGSPGDYVLLNQQTGDRLVLRQDPVNERQAGLEVNPEKEAQNE